MKSFNGICQGIYEYRIENGSRCIPRHSMACLALLKTKGLLGKVQSVEARLLRRDIHTFHVQQETLVDIPSQSLAHVGLALGRQEPRTRGKVVLVVDDVVEEGVEGAVGETVHTLDVGVLVLELGNALGVLEVPLRHLHVCGTLARSSGALVALVLKVDRLKGHERKNGGHLLDVVDAVVVEALGDEGGGLLGGAALVVLGVALDRLGGCMLDDGGGVEGAGE